MKLTFLGTRGYIDQATARHRRHTTTLVEYRGKRVLIDWGEDWRGKLDEVKPHAIVLTHAHPDHVGGLAEGCGRPVYATRITHELTGQFALSARQVIEPRKPFEAHGVRFEAFAVEHSTRCPAVGYRIEAGRARVFYLPDVAYLPDQPEALGGVQLYIGDGATIERSLVRRRGQALIGHTPIRTQLTWCLRAGVPRAIFTHCGTSIVADDERKLAARVRSLGDRENAPPIETQIAYDGLEVVL